MISIDRLPSTAVVDPAQSNLIPQHPAEAAAWIWHPFWDEATPALVEFTRTLELDSEETFTFHLTADQRFQLRINGELVARGPDRSDIHHWSVASYRARLPRGRVHLSVLVWWLPQSHAPLAQLSFRPGFLFAAEGALHDELSTGSGDWKARDRSAAINCLKTNLEGFHVIGPRFEFDLARWNTDSEEVSGKVVRRPIGRDYWGGRPDGWRLYPSALPEQKNEVLQPGRIRALRSPASGDPFHNEIPAERQPLASAFEAQLSQGASVTIPSGQNLEILWDLDSYRCGYPHLEVSGGAEARIRFEWAESLFQADNAEAIGEDTAKGNRDAIDGKSYEGFGDSWTLDGNSMELPALWWRSGRYLRILIETQDEALQIKRLAIRTTGYPFEYTGSFHSDHDGLNKAWPILIGGMEHCAHEQWVDCPYYEQLAYVGDNNTELSAYCLTRDESLSPRCLELFDWSRHDNGLVAERYPSSYRQDSFTYALLYPRLVKDFSYWRDDVGFMRRRLPGLRSLMENCLAQLKEDGLLHVVPGWPFIDWVKTWEQGPRTGCPPSAWEGDSSLVNLHLYFALIDYAAIEDGYGEAVLADRARKKARRLGELVKSKYWNDARSLLADDGEHRHFSEHAQSWAILSGILSESEEHRCLKAWRAEQAQLDPMSIYFTHYAFEAYYRLGAAEAFFDRLRFWEGLVSQGFRTTPERPEPSRSDCHGWGAHPIYHSFASIAGIRPTAPGFQSVRIAPMPGTLNHMEVRLPHPKGEIHFKWKRESQEEIAEIHLPEGLSGNYLRHGQSQVLKGGRQQIRQSTA